MSLIWRTIVYRGPNLQLLEEVTTLLHLRGNADVLFRMSESDKLNRILRYRTDRGGYPGRKPWRHARRLGINCLHEDVIIATTEQDIRRGEQEDAYSTSFKKLSIIADPLLLLYDASKLIRLQGKEYRFLDDDRKCEALLGIIPIVKRYPVNRQALSRQALNRQALNRQALQASRQESYRQES